MNQQSLFIRITADPRIFGGKPIVRVRRLGASVGTIGLPMPRYKSIQARSEALI